jgi:hypothetical protein
VGTASEDKAQKRQGLFFTKHPQHLNASYLWQGKEEHIL